MEGFVIGHFHKVHQVTPFRRIKSGRMPLILQAHQVLKPAIILHFRPQNFTKFIRKIARSVLFGFSAPLVVNGTISDFFVFVVKSELKRGPIIRTTKLHLKNMEIRMPQKNFHQTHVQAFFQAIGIIL